MEAPAAAPLPPGCEGFIESCDDLIQIRSIVPDPPKAKGIRLQTDKLERVNRRLQSRECKEVEVQTLEPHELPNAGVEVDEAELVRFLQTVAPMMEAELDVALESQSIFDAYEPAWDDMPDTVEVTHQIYKEGLVDLNVTSLAWNATGSVLACAYGQLDTRGWCEVSAPVCLWNIFRPQMKASTPDMEINIQGFVVSLAFHPTQPAVLAGGTYNGELMIWNTAEELDPLVAASTIDDYFHREAIQAVEWISADLSGGADAYLIATVSGDGKVLIWDARGNEQQLSHPSRGFMLLGSKKRVLGGRSMAFSPLDPWLFCVGSETGSVVRAFRPPPGASVGKPQGQYSWKQSAVNLLDQLAANSRLTLQNHVENHCRTTGVKEITAEVVFESKPDPVMIFPAPKTTDLEPHSGPVVMCAFSPFHRKVLLTGSTDGSVKLFDVLQQKAILSFFPPARHLSTSAVAAISWSWARPCVFAVAMERGGVYIYDLAQTRQEPVLELPLGGASGSTHPTWVVFNPKQRGMLSMGDSVGRVRVFRLPFRLATQQKDELGQLSRLIGSSGAAGPK